jgi:hypothetical protein
MKTTQWGSSPLYLCHKNIDLGEVLDGIPATCASFPLRYLGLTLSVWHLRRRYFQHLEDKCASKLPTWNGKLLNMAGRVSLVKSELASQAIYHLTPLTILPSTLKYINKLEQALLWVAKESTSSAKCEVNWETMCRPKMYGGGIGVLHMDKFTMALRLWWPWLEWKSKDKIWVETGNPCSNNDMDLFYAATTIALGNGKKNSFWHDPWVGGKMLKYIAPKIFEHCKRKSWTVAQDVFDNEWITKFGTEATLSIDHLAQFVQHWALIPRVHLLKNVEDEITWNLINNESMNTLPTSYPLICALRTMGACPDRGTCCGISSLLNSIG